MAKATYKNIKTPEYLKQGFFYNFLLSGEIIEQCQQSK